MADIESRFPSSLRDLITQKKRRERKRNKKLQYDFTGAALRGNITLVKELLEAGCRINEHCWTGCLALHYACSNSDKAMVELLLQLGANPNLTTKICAKEGAMALHYAASGGSFHWVGKGSEAGRAKDCIELLIEHGADVHARNAQGRTPLHNAVMFPLHGAEELKKHFVNGVGVSPWETYALQRVAVLIQHGADVNAKDGEGRTPFHYAAMAGDKRTRLLTLLREAGADETIRDFQNNRAYECAKEDVIKRFIEPDDAQLKREAYEQRIREMNEEFDRMCQEHFEETGEDYWSPPDGD